MRISGSPLGFWLIIYFGGTLSALVNKMSQPDGSPFIFTMQARFGNGGRTSNTFRFLLL